jgi:hypothetical protein
MPRTSSTAPTIPVTRGRTVSTMDFLLRWSLSMATRPLTLAGVITRLPLNNSRAWAPELFLRNTFSSWLALRSAPVSGSIQ